MESGNKHIKIAILISFACVSLTFLGSGVNAQENVSNTTSTIMGKIDTTNWKNYSDPVYGLNIKYPGDWQSGNIGESLAFTSIINEGGGVFIINVMDIEKNESIQNILRDRILSLKSKDASAVTTEPNKTKLANGVEIYQYQYTYTYSSGDPGKSLIAIAIDGGLKYFLEYAANSDTFDRNTLIIKTMINSFEPITFEFPESAP